jgi:hypothetical protein
MLGTMVCHVSIVSLEIMRAGRDHKEVRSPGLKRAVGRNASVVSAGGGIAFRPNP